MIICADFDGTIYLRGEEQKTAANFAAIKKWREAGNVFVLATNRGLGSVERALPNWRDYFDFLILDGGGKIMDAEPRLIWANTFDPRDLERMLRIADDNSAKPKIVYYGADDDDFKLEMSNSPLTKVRFWFENSDEAIEFAAKIKEVSDRAFVWSRDSTFRWSPTDILKGYYAVVDTAPNATNKASAIHALLEMNNLPDNVITVGDNINDLEMLEEFDGFAIEGSKIAGLRPELRTIRSVADLVLERLQR